MSEYVNFHYMPLEGKITGKQVLKQTEDVINDLGNKVYNIDIDEGRIDEAIEKSNEAINTANSALSAVTTGRSVWLNNVAEMVATDIEAGVTAETKGYYVANDGGNALYLIRQEKSGDVVDGGSLIALDNGNMAELVTDGTVNVKQFGAIGNGTDDDTTVFQNTSSYAQAKGFVPFVGVATYKITGSVTGTFNSFGEVTITGGGTVDIINLQEVVSDVSDIRDEVVDETASAKAYSESAATSATNASNSASSASTTARALTDIYNEAIASGQIVAPAVDPTLSIEGAAADAKVTGDKFNLLPFTDPYTPSTNTTKKYLNSSGVETTQNGWNLTDYIEVYGRVLTYSGLTVISYSVYSAFYDSTKTLIADSLFNAQRNGTYKLEIPANAKYVRFSMADADVNSFTIKLRISPTAGEFEQFKDDVVDYINDLPYYYPYDSSKNTPSKYFDSTGAQVSNTNWSITDYLPLGDFPQYSTPDKSNSVCFCYYNENKVFISAQILGTIKDAFVDMLPPANAKYVRFSVVKANADKFSYRYQVCANANDVGPFADIIAIPNDLYLYAGIQTNIYRDSLFAMDDTPNNIKCSYGLNYAEFWRYQPSASITADVSMTVQRYNTKYDQILAERTTTLHFGTSSHNAGTVNCMFIGDSTTEQGRYLYPLLTNFSNDSTVVNSVGTRPTLNYPSIMCEGRSGWALTDYVTYPSLSSVSNLFWNPTTSEFDFSYYMNNYQNGVSLDYVFILLGLNDVVGLGSAGDAGYHARKTEEVIASAQTFVSNLNTIAQSIKDYDNNITVVFGLITAPSKSQDAMRSSPPNSFHSREQYKRNIVIFNNEIIKGADQTIIKLLDTNLCIDMYNNMETATEQINSRNSNTIVRQNNLVHYPVEGGAQVADRIFAFLKCV